MRSKTILILAVFFTVLIVVVVMVLLLPSSSADAPRRPLFNKGQGLAQGEAILAKTWAGELGVHKGDVFAYFVEIWYDPAVVTEIDKASLDKEVNLNPFEIRDIQENSFRLEPRTRVYQRAYEIQLVSGEADHLYEFPTALIRYGLKGSTGLSNTSVTPEPVFVSSRVPPEIPDLQFGYGPLRPIAGKISGAISRLPWILWALGGCLAVLGAADLTRRALSGWSNSKGQRNSVGEGGLVGEAYRSLSENTATGSEPKLLLHQMDRILRLVLAQKEQMSWLEELDGDQVSPGIQELVVALLETCRKAYGPDALQPNDVENARQQLDQILRFYFGALEVETWRK